MTKTNKRGRLLLEMAARLDLVVANTRSTSIYRRPGFGNSIPDMTLTSERILPRVERWRVVENDTSSDHQYIAFDVTGRTRTIRIRIVHPLRWNTNKLDEQKFLEELVAS